MRVLLSLIVLLALTGCSSLRFPGVYRINVEQGNIITEEMIGQLKPGMSRRQVRYILGTPLVEDSFNRDRWDYVYVLRNGNTIITEDTLSVYFEGDTLERYSSSIDPMAEEDSRMDPGTDPMAVEDDSGETTES